MMMTERERAVSLLRRARAIINRWQELYGEHQPPWLPPAHQINWAEDAAAYIDAAKDGGATMTDDTNIDALIAQTESLHGIASASYICSIVAALRRARAAGVPPHDVVLAQRSTPATKGDADAGHTPGLYALTGAAHPSHAEPTMPATPPPVQSGGYGPSQEGAGGSAGTPDARVELCARLRDHGWNEAAAMIEVQYARIEQQAAALKERDAEVTSLKSELGHAEIETDAQELRAERAEAEAAENAKDAERYSIVRDRMISQWVKGDAGLYSGAKLDAALDAVLGAAKDGGAGQR
jgi:hypothetical protein